MNVVNVENQLFVHKTSEHIREFMQERSHIHGFTCIHVTNVGETLEINQALLYVKEFMRDKLCTCSECGKASLCSSSLPVHQ